MSVAQSTGLSNLRGGKNPALQPLTSRPYYATMLVGLFGDDPRRGAEMRRKG